MAAKKPEKPTKKGAAAPEKNKKTAPATGSKAGAQKAAKATPPVKEATSKKVAPASKKAAPVPTKSAAAPAKSAASKSAPAKSAVPIKSATPAKPAAPPARPAASAPARPVPAPAAKRPSKIPAKDLYSPATGTATSDPFPAKDLDKFRLMIQDLRSETIEELESLTEQLREMTASEVGEENSAYSLHMAEQGTDAMEREKTYLQAQRTNDYIKKLDESLRRIQDGTFGICRVCGLRLDSKRLMAVPVTQVCTVYKNTNKPCEPGRLRMQELGITEEDITK